MKKLLFLAAGFLFGTLLFASPVAKAVFNDVSNRSQYGPSVLHLQNEGIVEGFADGTFRPAANITRAEYTKILLLSKFEETQVLACDGPSFSDVERETWYAPYVCFAKANNIVAGYGDGAFRPNQPISYAEGAKILVNVLIANTTDAPPPQWWTPYMTILEAQGANPPSASSATASLSRGEMAYMASRTIRTTIAHFVQERFDGKLVYVTNPGTSVDELKAHCAVEGGEFDECGSPCSPDAEICADVCAYTCTQVATDTEGETDSPTTFILERFGSKIVYDQKEGATEEQLKKHCATEGGLYNACGNVCAPDATDCDDACVKTCEDIPQADATDEDDKVTIQETFPNKLVYTTATDEPVEKYQAHCAAGGGEFNECGNICAPDAEICAQVCAYTCTGFEDADEGNDSQSRTYENLLLGFRLAYPTAAKVDENADGENADFVDFRLAGATQPATGSLTDGILLRVSPADIGSTTLSAFVDARLVDERELTAITLPKERYDLGGREGFRFGSENGNFAFFPAEEGKAIMISALVKDPETKGYQAILDTMLDSLEFFETDSFAFQAGKVALQYPTDMFTVDSDTDSLTLTHGVPYKHADACDFQGTGKELTTLTDLDVTFTVSDANLETVATANESAGFAAENLTEDGTGFIPQQGFIEASAVGGLSGFLVILGAEGCGEHHYYYPLGENLTLFINRKMVGEFSESYAERDEALKVEGAILPDEAEAVFKALLESVTTAE